MSGPAERLVLVTGAARRIGAAIARRLHADGWAVAIHCARSCSDADALAASLNAQRAGSARVFSADLRDAKACANLLVQITAEWRAGEKSDWKVEAGYSNGDSRGRLALGHTRRFKHFALTGEVEAASDGSVAATSVSQSSLGGGGG